MVTILTLALFAQPDLGVLWNTDLCSVCSNSFKHFVPHPTHYSYSISDTINHLCSSLSIIEIDNNGKNPQHSECVSTSNPCPRVYYHTLTLQKMNRLRLDLGERVYFSCKNKNKTRKYKTTHNTCYILELLHQWQPSLSKDALAM